MKENFLRMYCKRRCKSICKHSIKLTSIIVLPLMLTIFTIVITFEQRGDAQRQRQQDLNISLMAHEQDRDIARQQRDNDMRIAQIQQNISRELDMIRYEQERQKYFDELLIAYMNDIGTLLEKNNGSLTTSSAVSALVTAKTLQILPLIGPIRATQLIGFLYRAGQLSTMIGERPLDLNGAHLINMNFTDVSFRHISLVGVHLINVSFSGQSIFEANFSNARLINVNFTRANCNRMNFHEAIMDNVDYSSAVVISSNFSRTQMDNVDFSSAVVTSSNFFRTQMNNVNFREVISSRTTFNQVMMNKVVFSYANLTQNVFDDCSLVPAIFDHTECSWISFARSILVSANFSETLFDNGVFSSVTAVNAIFHINQNRSMHRLTFLNSKLSHGSFKDSYLPNTRFVKSDLFAVDFRQSDISNSIFDYCDMEATDFSNANMTGVSLNRSSLAFATLFNARLTKAKFLLSDLSYTNLSKASCADHSNPIGNCSVQCAWENEEFRVLWKDNLVRCNGDTYQEIPFFQINHILCNESLSNSWDYVSDPPVVVQSHPHNNSLCVFAPSPKHMFSYLRTLVNLSRFENFIKTGEAALAVRARMNGQIEFNINKTPVNLSLTLSGLLQGKTGVISSSTENTELYVTFFNNSNSLTWLSYLEVIVVPYLPSL